MKCPNCKQEIDNNSAFCEYCGVRIKKSKKVLWVILGVVIIAVVIGTIAIVGFKQQSDDYVDLGLPSGTLWKKINEGEASALYTFNDAYHHFGNSLPTIQQVLELKNYCTWTWCDNQFLIEGTNGNSIIFPVVGVGDYDNDTIFEQGIAGACWTSTSYDSEFAYSLIFNYIDTAYTSVEFKGFRYSVRLVK